MFSGVMLWILQFCDGYALWFCLHLSEWLLFICVASTAVEMRKSYFECNTHLALKKCLLLPVFFSVPLEILFCWAASAIVYVVVCLQTSKLCLYNGWMLACLMRD